MVQLHIFLLFGLVLEHLLMSYFLNIDTISGYSSTVDMYFAIFGISRSFRSRISAIKFFFCINLALRGKVVEKYRRRKIHTHLYVISVVSTVFWSGSTFVHTLTV